MSEVSLLYFFMFQYSFDLYVCISIVLIQVCGVFFQMLDPMVERLILHKQQRTSVKQRGERRGIIDIVIQGWGPCML